MRKLPGMRRLALVEDSDTQFTGSIAAIVTLYRCEPVAYAHFLVSSLIQISRNDMKSPLSSVGRPRVGQHRDRRSSRTSHYSFEQLEPRNLLTVVADYVDDYAAPNPSGNWQYLWNENGQFGMAANYSAMTHDSWRYRPSATTTFPYLGATFAHPGSGVDEADSGGIDRYAIAAYTVTEAGQYQITDSLITREGQFGDGIEVTLHVNDQPVAQLLSLAPESSGSFDTVLGNLAVGDTIYVGVGPDGPGAGSSKGNDGVGFDFSIRLDATAPVTVSVDLETQRFLGEVSTLDRDKYFNFHSGATTDSQITAFRNEYDVGFGRQFWGPLPYARNQTGQVGVYPNVTPSSDQSVRPVTRIVQTGHPRDALRWDTDVQAAADWATNYYTTVVNEVPEFYEPMNEPFVHAGDSEFSDAPSPEAMRMKMAELYAAIGEAVDNTPALANMNVVGYASAWPSVELWDFGHWDSRMKMFMDVAGDHMDAFSTHLYDGVNVTGQNNRRSGSNSEAILDLIETYSFAKWGVVKPHAITEYGGIEDGYGDTYSDLRSAQSLRSINHFLFNLLEREDDLLISVPFITDKSTWFLDPANNCEPYGGALWRMTNHSGGNCNGTFEYTWRIHFFDLWKDVQGKRGVIETSDPDIQAQLFVDGSTAYVAINNLADNTQTVDLDFLSEMSGLQNVEIRQMEVPISGTPTYTETIQTTAPESVTLNSGGTAVLVYTFDSPIEFSKTVHSEKYYTSTHLQPINANQAITFNFNGVETAREGEGILRMSIGRKHDRSKAPVVTVNGTNVDVPVDWKGYDQANRDDFFGMIEIPVSMDLLATDNTVSVTFPDSGGRVSSMILAVEAVEATSTGDFDSDGDTDGFDFLSWQAGFANSYDATDLSNWQANYGQSSSPVAAISIDPAESQLPSADLISAAQALDLALTSLEESEEPFVEQYSPVEEILGRAALSAESFLVEETESNARFAVKESDEEFSGSQWIAEGLLEQFFG